MKIIISILLLALFLFNSYSIGATEVEKLNAEWTRLLNIKNALEEEEFSVNPKQEIAAPLLLEMARIYSNNYQRKARQAYWEVYKRYPKSKEAAYALDAILTLKNMKTPS